MRPQPIQKPMPLVPAHPAEVRGPRPNPGAGNNIAARAPPPELRDTEHESEEREQAAQRGRPDDHVGPERLIRTYSTAAGGRPVNRLAIAAAAAGPTAPRRSPVSAKTVKPSKR